MDIPDNIESVIVDEKNVDFFEKVDEVTEDKRHKRREESKRNNTELLMQVFVCVGLLILMIYVNYQVINIISLAMNNEFDLIKSGFLESRDRVVDSKLMMSLIGGTVLQIAGLLTIAVKFVFKNKD